MGHTIRTPTARYTEWVSMSYPAGVHQANWSEYCGRELYVYSSPSSPSSVWHDRAPEGERRNVVDDPSMVATVVEMRKQLHAGWRVALGAEEWPANLPDVPQTKLGKALVSPRRLDCVVLDCMKQKKIVLNFICLYRRKLWSCCSRLTTTSTASTANVHGNGCAVHHRSRRRQLQFSTRNYRVSQGGGNCAGVPTAMHVTADLCVWALDLRERATWTVLSDSWAVAGPSA